MTTNWENALKSIADHSQALGVVILDGPMRFTWSQPGLDLPLERIEDLMSDLAPDCETFRAVRLGDHPCLLYLVSQFEGNRCAFTYPLTTHLVEAKTDSQSFLKFARLAPPASLDSLKARDLHAYKHTPQNDTWQAEFLALYSDVGQTEHTLIEPHSDDDMATQPVSLFMESTRPVPIFTDSTQPIQLHLPEASPAQVTEETYWVKVV